MQTASVEDTNLRRLTTATRPEGVVMFEIEFGDCDEVRHPHCEGVECETVLLVRGFGMKEQAEQTPAMSSTTGTRSRRSSPAQGMLTDASVEDVGVTVGGDVVGV